jgi:DNA-directed RNA polymerase specialized sigma24 family protein
MATQRLIRARGDRGGALASVDVATLRAALEHLLERAPAQAYLLIAVALEDAPAEVVAAELSIAPAQVMREVQGALAALARQYEQIAFAGEVEEPGLYGALRRRVAGREPALRAVR